MSQAPQLCCVCEADAVTFFIQVEDKDYWRCNHCLATFLDPAQRPDQSTERAQYQLHRNEVDDPQYRRFLSQLADPLLAQLAPQSQGLDYGCGPGPALAAMLSEAGHQMTLYDPAFYDHPEALQRSYDFITCTEVIEHFHHPAAEFSRLSQCLKPGGILALMTSFQTDDAAFARWHYRRDPTHVVFYRPQTLTVVAQRLGWSAHFPARNLAFLCA